MYCQQIDCCNGNNSSDNSTYNAGHQYREYERVSSRRKKVNRRLESSARSCVCMEPDWQFCLINEDIPYQISVFVFRNLTYLDLKLEILAGKSTDNLALSLWNKKPIIFFGKHSLCH